MCIADIETWWNRKKYAQQKLQTVALAEKIKELYPTPQIGPYVDQPDYQVFLEQCVKNFVDYAKNSMSKDEDRTWGVGDSILAQARDRIDHVIDPRLNMAKGGAWAHHMLRLINDITPLFEAYKWEPKNIVIGTPNGNAILLRQEINSVIDQALIVIKRLRELYPQTRIIIYGLPATYVEYAIQCFPAYDFALFKWMTMDSNAVMLPLIKHFVENLHILPKPDMSSDGVHMTPTGQVLFGELIQRGKTGKAKSLIN